MTTSAPPLQLSPVLDYLQRLHQTCAAATDGKRGHLHPRAGQGQPRLVRHLPGHDRRQRLRGRAIRGQPFTIQSISKPFVYGLALEDNGRAEVLEKIGVEPTGDAFNAISLEPGTGRPRNPMINAGAIAAAGLIAGQTPRPRLRRMLEMFCALRRPRAGHRRGGLSARKARPAIATAPSATCCATSTSSPSRPDAGGGPVFPAMLDLA